MDVLSDIPENQFADGAHAINFFMGLAHECSDHVKAIRLLPKSGMLEIPTGNPSRSEGFSRHKIPGLERPSCKVAIERLWPFHLAICLDWQIFVASEGQRFHITTRMHP